MASLYKRASPSQQQILRIVEGAVRNAADAHPNINVSPQHRRSIAKRAAGTLAAQWPQVLAAGSGQPSESGRGVCYGAPGRRSSDFGKAVGRGASQTTRRSPLGRLRKRMVKMMWDLKRNGPRERYDAFVEVLRMIAEEGVRR